MCINGVSAVARGGSVKGGESPGYGAERSELKAWLGLLLVT